MAFGGAGGLDRFLGEGGWGWGRAVWAARRQGHRPTVRKVTREVPLPRVFACTAKAVVAFCETQVRSFVDLQKESP